MRLPRVLTEHVWPLLRDTVVGFFYDDALSKGASIAFYTVFSLAPILLIATAIAGLFFGYDAARGAVARELGGLIGYNNAQVVQEFLAGAKYYGSTVAATAIGVVTLGITATGALVELQSALDYIWKASPQGSVTTAMVRARLLALALLGTLGFLLLVSLIVSTALQAASTYFGQRWHEAVPLLAAVDGIITFVLITLLFAAIYKVLPARQIAWKDVAIGAICTSVLFAIGKSLISVYLGRSAISSAYGSAGSLLVFLLWIYYSTQIFLLGAEFTRVYAERRRGGQKPPLEQESAPH